MPERRSAWPGKWTRLLPAFLLLSTCPVAMAELTLSQGTNLSVDVSGKDGRLIIDLLGSLWIVPQGGGTATRVNEVTHSAARPRWSPDGDSIVYQVRTPTGSRIRRVKPSTGAVTELSDGASADQHPAWHPAGDRLVFSSARQKSGFDLWEMHLPTGLRWRLTAHSGDETEPAWSFSGRHLAYILHEAGRWRLMLRRHGQPEQELIASSEPLAAPSWRPDGSLLTFLQQEESTDSYALRMVILSDPPLLRSIATGEDFFLSPVSWRDRLTFFYSADGIVKKRGFNDWRSTELPFSASLDLQPSGDKPPADAQSLPIVSPSRQRLVIRAARLFDGVTPGYREATDVLLENGKVAAVKRRQEWDDATVLDLGDSTLLPGFIDVYASLPEGDPRNVGRALLSYGVTTVVTEDAASFDASLWESEHSPGPRLLRAAPVSAIPDDRADGLQPRLSLLTLPSPNRDHVPARPNPGTGTLPILAKNWTAGLPAEVDLVLGAETIPASPLGIGYADLRLTQGTGSATLVSGLADGATPGLDQLLQSRQALAFRRWFRLPRELVRRYTSMPQLGHSADVVIGSRPSGLAAGPGLHAEMRALAAAGVSGEGILRAAGANAGDALGLQEQLGRIVPGALADLVLVTGDPLQQVSDSLNIVAVVRNGRFYSLVRLLEQAETAESVE